MEVTVTIEFTCPCLGNVRQPDYDRMQRDQDGNVIFLPTWWRSALSRAARAINRYYKIVDQIRPALQAHGPVTMVRRQFGRSSDAFHMHEGFDVGAKVVFSFLIPGCLTISQFTELLEAVGCYISISPYGWKTGKYGFFKVLEVRKGGPGTNQKGRKPAAGGAGSVRHPGTGADIQSSNTGGAECP